MATARLQESERRRSKSATVAPTSFVAIEAPPAPSARPPQVPGGSVFRYELDELREHCDQDLGNLQQAIITCAASATSAHNDADALRKEFARSERTVAALAAQVAALVACLDETAAASRTASRTDETAPASRTDETAPASRTDETAPASRTDENTRLSEVLRRSRGAGLVPFECVFAHLRTHYDDALAEDAAVALVKRLGGKVLKKVDGVAQPNRYFWNVQKIEMLSPRIDDRSVGTDGDRSDGTDD